MNTAPDPENAVLIERIDEDPMVQGVLELQRQLSQATTAEDLVYAFATRFRELGGVTHVVSLDVREAPEGSYRVRDMIDLSPDQLSRDHVFANNRWDDHPDELELHDGGLLGALVLGEFPKVFRGVSSDDDDRLAGFLDVQKDGLAVPVFVDGQVAEWAIVFRSVGEPIDPVRMRLGIGNLNLLSRSVQQLKLNREISELSSALEHQLSEVGRLQRSILPDAPPDSEQISIAVRYMPCDAAGGDYYDFRRFGPSSIGVAIADVSGHGPVAAVAMAMLRTAMHSNRLYNRSPDTVVEDMNAIMFDGLRDGMFVTGAFIAIDEQTGDAGYFNCGHCYPLVRRADGRVERLTGGHGPPLGVLPEMDLEAERTNIAPGDSIVLYTDGITEAFNPEGELFGEKRLQEVITDCDGPPEDTVDRIWNAVERHARGLHRKDDQCVLVVRRAT